MAKLGERYKILLFASLIGITVFGLLQAVSYWFNKYRQHPAWALIPANAVAVIEIHDVTAAWRELRNSAAWQALSQIPYFQQWHRQAAKLDSLNVYATLFYDKKIYISWHLTAKNDFDVVFYVPLQDSDVGTWEKLQQLFVEFQPLPQETRLYQGEKLYELTDRHRSRIFTFFVADGYWIGSFTPYLIEDVVRTYTGIGRDDFQSNHADLFAARQLLADASVRLYINAQKVKDWVGAFAELHDTALLSYLTDDLLLIGQVKNNGLQWRGVTANTNNQQLTYFLKNNPPLPLHPVAKWIPSQTAYIYRLGAANGKLLYQQMRRYWATSQPVLINAMDSLADKIELDTEAFFALIDGGVVLAASEDIAEQQADYWTIVGSKDSRKALRMLEQAAKEVLPRGDTLFAERYSKYRIVELPLPELPYLLFGTGFNGFARVFVTAEKDRLIFCNHLVGIKRYIDAIESGNTWALPEKQYLFSGMDSAAHISLIVHHKHNWTRQQNYLHPQAKAAAMAHMRQWLFFTHFGFQLTGMPQGHFTAEIILGHSQSRNRNNNTPVKLWETATGSPLREPPQLVLNHNTRAAELIFQDQNNLLHLVTADGKKLWSLPIGAPVTDGYLQIDYFNNGKLQYLFTTPHAIYLIDRLGRIVNSFPIVHQWGAAIDRIGLIDYDNTKDYRLAVTTANGDIFLMNKNGQLLQGWRPRKTTGAPAFALKHIRAQSRDCMIALQENGGVMLMKRNGESYPGFPVALQQPIFPAVVIETDASFEKHALRVLTQSGDLFKIDFQGRILAREQYYNDAAGGYFSLCTDPNSNRWVVARQVNNQLTVSDATGKNLCQLLLPDSSPYNVQFFGFGAGADLIAVINPKTEQCYLYLANGNLLTARPLPTKLPVAIRLNEQQQTLQVFTAHQNKLQAWEIAL
ncbi:MAG: hypothetical protein RMJ87_07845 [Cytophagales bacterium]|nr:hypothetical protein [Bernardetiaceae bacterium]MDW8204924.1 hypothetical protein [Cytophagales bacterium]